jgi:uncharacterized membrane protein
LSFHTILLAGIFCILPISELRGGLPFALSQGMPLIPAYLYCVLINLLAAPIVMLFLATLHKLLSRIKVYDRLFERIVERARKKVKAKVDKYGYWGLALFVSIPLPVTGAYTGTLGAWILGMNRKKSILAVSAGVFLAGIYVSIVYFLVTEYGLEALRIFLRES